MKIFGFILVIIGFIFLFNFPFGGFIFMIPGIFLLLFGKSGTQKAVEKQNELLEKEKIEKNNQNGKEPYESEEKELKIAKRMQELITKENLSITEANMKANMEYILEKEKEEKLHENYERQKQEEEKLKKLKEEEKIKKMEMDHMYCELSDGNVLFINEKNELVFKNSKGITEILSKKDVILKPTSLVDKIIIKKETYYPELGKNEFKIFKNKVDEL